MSEIPFVGLPPEQRQVAMELSDDLRDWIMSNVIGKTPAEAAEAMNAWPLAEKLRMVAQVGGMEIAGIEAAVSDIVFTDVGEGSLSVDVKFKKSWEIYSAITKHVNGPDKEDE